MPSTFEDLSRATHDALPHLYDPTYEPAEVLWVVTGCSVSQGVHILQNALIQAIRDLEPSDNVPVGARSRRLYQLLSLRYLQQQTQERAADHLGITARHLRREQNEAIELLARHLWQQRPAGSSIPEDIDKDTAWRAQLAIELGNLQESSPGAITDMITSIQGAVTVGRGFLAQRGIHLQLLPLPEVLSVAMHPAALRQILISCLRQVGELIVSGTMIVEAARIGETAQVTVTGSPILTPPREDDGFSEDILAIYGGSIETAQEGNIFRLKLQLPLARAITVLVIDDNDDLVHFYRRYTTGTRYHIVHEREGLRVFDTLESMSPDIIVLDIMLPDIDGWELLSHLYDSVIGRAVPIIVCSVVREAELALSLGASLCLSKPVHRADFVKALDRALSL
jgi:CheY-like chemotaxis protein